MTSRHHVRTIGVGAAVAVFVVLAVWREGDAQFPPPPKWELKDLLDSDTFKKASDGLKKLKDLDELTKKQDDFYKSLDKLSPDDDQYEPQDLPGTPELPSLCKNSNECEDCYKQPYADLQNTRLRFDKLRRVNRVTKNMLRDSLAFGDAAASAAGGIAGLAWAKEKEKIRASEQSFNNTYDAKLAELLATLKNNLMGIAACEEKIFHNENWYERYGFVYHQFMAEAYRRPD